MSPFQPSLFGTTAEPSFDPAFTGMERVRLNDSAWLDVLPECVKGPDALFEQIRESRDWGQRTRWMYEKQMLEPRLTSPWFLDSGEPLLPAILEELRQALNRRYNVRFDSVGFNLYRDGRDSVAWHRDQISKEIPNPIVVLLSLGERRKFQVRPRGGGPARSYLLGRGDLLVTGGTAQRGWEHCVPKVAHAGPRMSLAFRYGLASTAYGPVATAPEAG